MSLIQCMRGLFIYESYMSLIQNVCDPPAAPTPRVPYALWRFTARCPASSTAPGRYTGFSGHPIHVMGTFHNKCIAAFTRSADHTL